MATNRSTDEKITEIDEKIAQLKNQRRRLQNKVNSEEKKARDRRHFKIGELVEAYCGEITNHESFKKYLEQYSYAIKRTQINEEEKIAMLTGNAIQDDETFKYEGGFIPERDQLYIELKQGENTFLIGFTDILLCLKLLEQLDEIPKIPSIWWQQAQSLYGGKANMLELNILEEKEVQQDKI